MAVEQQQTVGPRRHRSEDDFTRTRASEVQGSAGGGIGIGAQIKDGLETAPLEPELPPPPGPAHLRGPRTLFAHLEV